MNEIKSLVDEVCGLAASVVEAFFEALLGMQAGLVLLTVAIKIMLVVAAASALAINSFV